MHRCLSLVSNILTQIHTQIQVADFIPNLSFQLWIWASAMAVLEHIGPNIEDDKFSRDKSGLRNEKGIGQQTLKEKGEIKMA